MDFKKLKQDPYYFELYQKYGEQFIIDAGYFESPATIIDIDKNLCTPKKFLHQKFFKHYKKSKNKACVLVTTGSFAPIHSGHVDMMNAAKELMIKQGYRVLGGYFCPDHDAYITEKLGDKAINIHERVKAIDRMTWENTWLTADPWMGLYCDNDVNFTVVIERIRTIVNKEVGEYFDSDVEIIFVCGEDRINFANTFVLKGRCIVVRRSDEMINIKKFLFDLDQKKDIPNDFLDRVYFELDNTNYESSTNIRKAYTKILEKKSLILRYDSRENKYLNHAIITLLRKYYTNITLYDIAEQEKSFESLNVKTISLDPLMKGTVNIPISREYDCFGFKFLGFVVRPQSGYSQYSIKEYINEIPKFEQTEYWLFDDDVCGGATTKYVRDLLEKKGVKIAGIITFLKSSGDEEVMDLRDLIEGHKYGGLVVNGIRLPYFYPYVDPYIRASILKPEEFSKEINIINDEYNRSIKDFQEKCRLRLANI